MKPIEIVELIKNENPDLLGKMTDRRAASIVRASLMQLAKQLDGMEDGVLKIAGFGKFQVRNKEKEKQGQMVNVKTINFTVNKPKVSE
jgi:nucleoid DNA-binding protein